jgi:hypothetical protein
LSRNILHDVIRRAVYRFRLDAGVDLVVDVIHDDKIIKRESDLSGEPI